MSQKINFTQAALEQLPPAAPGKRYYVNDTQVAGLQLQVTGNSVKTFYVYRRVQGRPSRIKLGRFPDLKLAQA
ncbi:MAG TPA: Arm DNA-binding domain-containing protein, partial [Gammaproteobacteria bacterium]|nr:Arm DNA-binding domain-containing protein [Gammaproteobacteria bacterium]